MSGMTCKCSLIMPVRNGAPYIKRAVQSVLEQSFSDWNLIIVNDASTDATEEAVSEFLKDDRIRYISCARQVGVSRARNIGLDNASGHYVVFLDCDDRLMKDSVKNRVDEMDKHAAEFGFFGVAIRNGNNVAVKQPQPGGGARQENL